MVVGDAHELDGRRTGREPGRVEDGVADTPVAVLGPAPAADVDEERRRARVAVGDLAGVRHVRVAEEDGAVRVLLGHPRHGVLRPVLVQVLVDAPRAAVHGQQLAGRRLEDEAVLERAQEGARLVGGHRVGPGERRGALRALLVGLVDAAAVAGAEADALVVVAHQRRHAPVPDQRGDLVGERPVADEVAEAERLGDPAAVDVREDRLEPGQVAVDVRVDGERRGDGDCTHRDCSSNQGPVV